MKVIVKENLGAEYTSDLISSCNQSGIQAIADYTGDEILFYDPKNWLYGRHSDMMKDASLEDDIFSIFNGKTPELRAKVLKPAKGEGFREFAVEWNNLQKQENPDIIKTKQCDMIRFGAHESGMSRSSMKGEYTVKIEWVKDFPEFGISAGDSDEVRVRFSEIDALAHAHGGNGLDELIDEKMNEKHPGIGQLDYEDDYIITNEEEMFDYHDRYIGRERVYETFDVHEGGKSNGGSGMKEVMADWYIENFPSDADMADDMSDATFADLWSGLKSHSDVYDLIGVRDSTVRERLFLRLAELRKTNYKQVYMMMFKEGGNHIANVEGESIGDDSRDWSSNEEEIEIQWVIDDDEYGIESGETESVVIDLDLVDCFEELVYQVTNALEREHGRQFDYDDEWILVDELELIKRFGCSMCESMDNPNDWSASEGEVEIVWTTDFPEYQIEVGDTDHFVVDFDVVLPNDYDMESNCLKEEVCRLIRDEYPGIDVEEYDFDITNEREFWGNQADSRIYPYD